MTIRAQSADGQIHEFPDGTDPSVVDRTMKQYAQTQAQSGLSYGQRWQQSAEQAYVKPPADTQGPLGLYADTIRQFPANLANAQNQSYAMFRSGLHDIGQGDVLSGAVGAGLGGLGFLGAPVSAALTPLQKPINAFVGQPLEQATGIPAPVTNAALTSLIPGAGIVRGPLSVRPTVPMGMSRPAGEVLLRQLNTDDTLSGAGAARIANAGPNAMVADAGPAAANLLDTAMQRSGPGATAARQAIEQRSSQANQDLTGALNRTMGTPQGVESQQAGIRTVTAPARSQAYNQAYRQPIDYTTIEGRNIEQLMERVPPEAINQANRMMRAEGAASRQIRATVHDDGTVTFEQLPDVRQLDYITRGLNEVAQGAEGQGAMRGTTAVGRIYSNLSQEIRNNLRQAVPEYGHALDTAADPIQRIQAIEFGAQILNPKITRDEVAMRLQGMGANERQAAVSGLRSQIDEIAQNVKQMASDPNVDARQLRETLKSLSSSAAGEKIAAAIGPSATRDLMQQIRQSSRALELRAQVAVNSRTFGRQSTAAQVSAQAEPGIVGMALEGHPLQAARKFVQSITRMTPERRLAMEDRIYGEIANALTTQRGRQAENFLNQLRSEITLRAGIRQRQATRVGATTATAPSLIQGANPIKAPLPMAPSVRTQPDQQQQQAPSQTAWTGSGGPLNYGPHTVNGYPYDAKDISRNVQGQPWPHNQNTPAQAAAADLQSQQAARELAATRQQLVVPDRNRPMTWASRGSTDELAGEIINQGQRPAPTPQLNELLRAMASDFTTMRDAFRSNKTNLTPKEAAAQEAANRKSMASRGEQMREGNAMMNEQERAKVEEQLREYQQRIEARRQMIQDALRSLGKSTPKPKDVPSSMASRNF